MTPLIVIVVPVVAAIFAYVSVSAMEPEPEFWAFVEVVQVKEVGMFGMLQEVSIKGPIEVNEPKAIADVVDLEGYPEYKIMQCSHDLCDAPIGGYGADHVLENHQRFKVFVD